MRPFKATFADPPIASAEFGVDFAFDAKPPAAHPHVAPPALRSARLEPSHPEPLQGVSAPVREATAIPASSPYALPEHPAPTHEGH